MKITADAGFYFGIGIFETIAVENGYPVFLKEHLERMMRSAEKLGLRADIRQAEESVGKTAEEMRRGAVKIVLSEKNQILEKRDNPYSAFQYSRGFETGYSPVFRNSTSPLTYIKSLNCADGILEKQRWAKKGIQEPIFLNERGEVAEGAVSNFFLVMENGEIVTPSLECGLLPGIVREKLLENKIVSEKVIYPETVEKAREAFLTNSLMGVMPIRRVGEKKFGKRKVTAEVMKFYRNLWK